MNNVLTHDAIHNVLVAAIDEHYDNLRKQGIAFDAWLSAIPTDPYDPCPCGCGKKYRYVEKDPTEEASHMSAYCKLKGI